jgi:hypothetical protein
VHAPSSSTHGPTAAQQPVGVALLFTHPLYHCHGCLVVIITSFFVSVWLPYFVSIHIACYHEALSMSCNFLLYSSGCVFVCVCVCVCVVIELNKRERMVIISDCYQQFVPAWG